MTSSFVAKQGNERALDDVLSQNFSLLSSTHRPQHHENLLKKQDRRYSDPKDHNGKKIINLKIHQRNCQKVGQKIRQKISQNKEPQERTSTDQHQVKPKFQRKIISIYVILFLEALLVRQA